LYFVSYYNLKNGKRRKLWKNILEELEWMECQI
jgi:hypothetical protein